MIDFALWYSSSPKHFHHLLLHQSLGQHLTTHCDPTSQSWPSTSSTCSFLLPAPPEQKVNMYGSLTSIDTVVLSGDCGSSILLIWSWPQYVPAEPQRAETGLSAPPAALLFIRRIQGEWAIMWDNGEIYVNIRTRIPSVNIVFPMKLICFWFEVVFISTGDRGKSPENKHFVNMNIYTIY